MIGMVDTANASGSCDADRIALEPTSEFVGCCFGSGWSGHDLQRVTMSKQPARRISSLDLSLTSARFHVRESRHDR